MLDPVARELVSLRQLREPYNVEGISSLGHGPHNEFLVVADPDTVDVPGSLFVAKLDWSGH